MNANEYPFKFERAFFKDIQFSRAPVIPDVIHFVGDVAFKCVDDGFPEKIEFFIRFCTGQEVKILLEIVGIFSYIGNNPETHKNYQFYTEFFQHEAINILWPFINQVVTFSTSQLGLSPIEFPKPQFDHPKDVSDESNN